ncbi:MAG: hypothetical protein EXS68_00205 [Candidatus Ryanbacteria bacterium]|nr:hypothetical protein [Candidatus Ryanbacteria bacterium]
MIVDRTSFIEITQHLEVVSVELLGLTSAFANWTEQGASSTEVHEFLVVANHPIGANEALGAIRETLHALLEANRAEGVF